MEKEADLPAHVIATALAAPVLLGAAAGGAYSHITGPTSHDVETVEAAIEDRELQEFLTELERKKQFSKETDEVGK